MYRRLLEFRCKVLRMGRDAFERLMGPAEEVLKKEVEEYERLNLKLAQSKAPEVVGEGQL